MGSVLNPSERDPLLSYEYDRGSPYENELRLTQALGALIPEEQVRHPDHRFFQMAHLVTEHAWCHMHYEMRRVIHHVDDGRYVEALRLLGRASAVNEVALVGVRLLQEYLPQHSLLVMRNALPADATGLDSPGHRNLRRVAKALWSSFRRAMEREGASLRELIEVQNDDASGGERSPAHGLLALLREEMVRLDTGVLAWKQSHLRMVWSQLGGHPDAGHPHEGYQHEGRRAPEALPTSLGGRPISVMQRRANTALFPALWQSIEDMYRELAEPEVTHDCSN